MRIARAIGTALTSHPPRAPIDNLLMVAAKTQHFFLTTTHGQRFCTLYEPSTSQSRGALLYLHPLAEEMNKSRRMAALQSRALAAQGFTVLQLDLLGCGDSSGDFGDASWAQWIDDALAGLGELRARSDAPLWLWGLRTGALLAGAVASKAPRLAGLLMWQPVVSGQLALQQFLRLRSAGEVLGNGAKGVVAGLRADLAAGRAVEVAGYRLSPALASGLEQATLQLPPPVLHVSWLEVAAKPDARLAPAAAAVIERWQAAGVDVCTSVVCGPAFWQTTEIEDAPALIAATLGSLSTHTESCAA